MILKKLEKYIETSGLKQKKIAEMLNITPQHLCAVINNKLPLSAKLENDIREIVK